MNLIYAVQSRNQESQGSLAVVINWTFTSGSVDLHTSFFTNHRHVILFFACEIFVVVLNHKINLTAKFSRSTVLNVKHEQRGIPPRHVRTKMLHIHCL